MAEELTKIKGETPSTSGLGKKTYKRALKPYLLKKSLLEYLGSDPYDRESETRGH